MVKPAVFNAFHMVGSGLWMPWWIILKVYEYVRVRYL
jgi:hypothetical protein